MGTRSEPLVHALGNRVAWLAVSRVLTQAYTFAATIYIANLLSPADFALMGVGMLMIGLLNLFTEFGLGEVVVQRRTLSLEQITGIFWFTALIGALLSVICCVAAPLVEYFFRMAGTAAIVRALSVNLFLTSIFVVPYKLIERNLRFRLKAVIDLVAKFVSMSMAGVLAWFGYGVWSLVWAQLLHSLTLALLSYLYQPVRPRRFNGFSDLQGMMNFGLNIIGLRFAWYLKASVDSIIGGRYLTAVGFGYYSFAFKLTQNIHDVFLNVMNITSVPLLARCQDDHEAMNRTYLNLTRFSVLLVFPVFTGLFMLSAETIGVFLAPKWMPITDILKIACLVQLLRMVNAVGENLFIAQGNPEYSMKMNVIMIAVMTPCFLLGARQWGLAGMLRTWMLAFPLMTASWVFFALRARMITIGSYMKTISGALCGSAMMALMIYLARTHLLGNAPASTGTAALARLLVLGAIGALTYAAVAYRVDRMIFGPGLAAR